MFEKMEARGRKKLNSLSDASTQEEGSNNSNINYPPGMGTPKNDGKER